MEMNEELRKQYMDQIERVEEQLIRLKNMLSGGDTEKERISMLVVGYPDLYITNPEQYERLKEYADVNKPPFTPSEIMRVMFGLGDTRLTYEQREEWRKKHGD
jgi:hypothetical protein